MAEESTEHQQGRIYRFVLNHLTKALQTRPEDVALARLCAIHYVRLAGRKGGSSRRELLEKACSVCQKAAGTKVNSHAEKQLFWAWADAITELAKMERGEKRRRMLRKAIQKYEGALYLAPGNQRLLRQYALATTQLAVTESAAEQGKLLAEAKKKLSQVSVGNAGLQHVQLLACIHVASGEISEAIQLYDLFIGGHELPPSRMSAALTQQAILAHLSGDMDTAEDLSERAVILAAGSNPLASEVRANVELATSGHRKACQKIRELMEGELILPSKLQFMKLLGAKGLELQAAREIGYYALYRSAGVWGYALMHSDKLIDLAPNHPYAYLLKAFTLHDSEQYDAEAKVYLKILTLDPTEVGVVHNLLQLLSTRFSAAETVRFCKLALKHTDTESGWQSRALVTLLLASAYGCLGDYGSAVFYCDEVMHLAPSEPSASEVTAQALGVRATARDKLGRSDAARRDFAEALRADPNNITILNNYAFLLGTGPKRDLDEALNMIDKAISLSDERPRPEVLDTKAWLLHLSGKHQRSYEILCSIPVYQRTASTLYYMADALSAVERYEEALDACREALDLPDQFRERERCRALMQSVSRRLSENN